MRASMMFLALAAVAPPVGAQQQQDTSIMDVLLRLPKTVDEGRRAGIPDGSIMAVLDSLHRRGVPAADAGQIVQAEVDAVKGGAPKENFGKYVNAMLARGLRGRELAAAIHAEHARRGMGRGHAQGAGPGKGRGRKP